MRGMRPARLLVPVIACLALGFAGRTRADVSAEARSAADVFERKTSLADCLVYVAGDLKVRAERAPGTGPAVLLLLVDPTASMRAEMTRLAQALPGAWSAGPRGLRIAVSGVAAETTGPTEIPSEAMGALQALAALPADGDKNLLEAVRSGVELLSRAGAGPKAMVLVTKEGGEGEDDVEATREVLADSGAAFYAIAPEAAFERAWSDGLDDKPTPGAALARRFVPEPKRREKGTLFHGGETAYGLVPYRWELSFAQAEFVWLRPPAYPVPSGFGYWDLATLAYATGGRYFVFDFVAAAAAATKFTATDARKTLYDYGRLRLLAPDLRPRERVLRDLEKDPRAQAIVRIWQHLADEARPVVGDLGTLERVGAGLQPRAARAVRSRWAPPGWLEDEDAVRETIGIVQGRVEAVDRALEWWSQANAREARARPETGQDPLAERVEADFLLLGVQLMKVRFSWGEALAALKDVKPLDLSYRRVRLKAVPLVAGWAPPARPVHLGDPERDGRFAELMAAQARLAQKHPQTPWSLLLEKGYVLSFQKEVQVIEPEEARPAAPEPPRDGKGKKPPTKPPPAAPPPAPPPPGPRPGSGGAGPVTGG